MKVNKGGHQRTMEIREALIGHLTVSRLWEFQMNDFLVYLVASVSLPVHVTTETFNEIGQSQLK